MQFAINYSDDASELLQAGQIEVDLFKCPNWDDLIPIASQQRPVYVHFPLIAGQQRLGDVDWDGIQHRMETTATQFVNLHIAPLPAFVDMDNPSAVIDCLIADVMTAAEVVPVEQVIIENIPYPDPWHDDLHPIAVNAQVIAEVIRQTGCGFLLDVAHARLAGMGLGIETNAYLESLPVHAIQELHITGIAYDEQRRLSDHFELDDADWQLFVWVMEQIHQGNWKSPQVVAFEYGGIGGLFETRSNRQRIAEQVPRLYDIVKR